MAGKDGKGAAEAVRGEMLFPESSPDWFTVEDRRFQIRQMPFTYERRVLALLEPTLGRVLESPDGAWGAALVGEFSRLLPEVVAIVAQMTDPAVTPEWVADRMIAADMVDVVRRQLEKNKLMDRVADFFRSRGTGAARAVQDFLSTPS